jgi:hypothetical protein
MLLALAAWLAHAYVRPVMLGLGIHALGLATGYFVLNSTPFCTHSLCAAYLPAAPAPGRTLTQISMGLHPKSPNLQSYIFRMILSFFAF